MNKAKMFTEYSLTFDGLPVTILTAWQSLYPVNIQAEIVPHVNAKEFLGVFCPFAGQNVPFDVYGRFYREAVVG